MNQDEILENEFNKTVKSKIKKMSEKRLREDLYRAKQLLRASHNIIKEVGHGETFYDGTVCDSYCLVEDISYLFDEEEQQFFED